MTLWPGPALHQAIQKHPLGDLGNWEASFGACTRLGPENLPQAQMQMLLATTCIPAPELPPSLAFWVSLIVPSNMK